MRWRPSTLVSSLVNGSYGDPALRVQLKQYGINLLFDCGSLQALDKREILRCRHIFLTHCHMDHFIGFDHLLRMHVPLKPRLNVYGPPGTIVRIQHKLSGYLWNLLKPGELVCEVAEWDGLELKRAELCCENDFQPQNIRVEKFESKVMEVNPASSVHSCLLDHGTWVAAYLLKQKPLYRVRAEVVSEMGLRTGPWLGELIESLEEGRSGQVNYFENNLPVEDLRRCVVVEEGESLCYATDFKFSMSNISRLRGLAQGVGLFVCESNFAEEDRDRAWRTRHLTSRQCGLVAAAIGAKALKVFHISSLYGKKSSQVEGSAYKFFEEFQGLSAEELERELEEEEKKAQLSAGVSDS